MLSEIDILRFRHTNEEKAAMRRWLPTLEAWALVLLREQSRFHGWGALNADVVPIYSQTVNACYASDSAVYRCQVKSFWHCWNMLGI